MLKKVYSTITAESLAHKIKWMLSLSVKERYRQAVEMGDFIQRLNKNIRNVKRASKSIQILKQK